MKRRFLVGGVLLCAVSSAAVEPPARIHSVQVAARSADNAVEVGGLKADSSGVLAGVLEVAR